MDEFPEVLFALNKELQEQELEALRMTLNEKELVVLEDEERTLLLNILPCELDKEVIVKQDSTNELRLKQFPKLSLRVTLLPTYPSHSSPAVEVAGFYGAFSSKIKLELSSRWEPDMLVLYEWFAFCQGELVRDIANEVLVVDAGAFQQLREEQLEVLEFSLDVRETPCAICYGAFTGRECFLVLQGCRHFFCRPCLRRFAEDLIERGEVGRLVCPHAAGCTTPISEADLRALGVAEATIEKAAAFALNQALERMDDFGWCPLSACAGPADIDRVKNFGRCTHCNFTFCLTCREKAHFFRQCPALKIRQEHITALSESAALDDFKRSQANQIMERMNVFYIQHCTKSCPSCRFPT